MGDMILTLPAIKGIKLANPNAKIFVLASEKNSFVLKKLNFIDKIITIKTKSNFFTLIKNLNIIRKTKFEYFLNFSPTFESYFFCFFSNSEKKGALIFLSRYKKSFFSKLILRILSNIFCNYTYTIDRFSRLKNNQEIHQTKMIFKFIYSCNILCNLNSPIEIFLPKNKLKLTNNKESLITIHLSEKWINKFYDENKFLELISKLPKKNYKYVLTTDNSTEKKFKKIYDNYKIIQNKNFSKIKKLTNNVTILNKLNFENWKHIIYSSKQVITPECGCTHISAACRIPVIIIYDPLNKPSAIYKEYHPWKNKHKKLSFDEFNINKKIISILK
tara:strand:- start:3293 stop:4285 length:993 start_codon:yes stop_codon:yes gene_type:complete